MVKGLLVRTAPTELIGYLSFLNFLTPMIIMPIITLLYVKYLTKSVQ